MTLGEKISALRNQHEMSQGDLAEKMNVSRQSISKWETDTSVPELEKLIQLSEVFHITLDELVKGDTTPEHETSENSEPEYKGAPPQPVQVEIQKSSNTQKIVGIILLCFGALVLLLLTVLGGVLSGLLFPLRLFSAVLFVWFSSGMLGCGVLGHCYLRSISTCVTQQESDGLSFF